MIEASREVKVDDTPEPRPGRAWCALMRGLDVAWGERQDSVAGGQGLAREKLGSCEGHLAVATHSQGSCGVASFSASGRGSGAQDAEGGLTRSFSRGVG